MTVIMPDADGLYPCCRVYCPDCKERSCECGCRIEYDPYKAMAVRQHAIYGTSYDHARGRPFYLPKWEPK